MRVAIVLYFGILLIVMVTHLTGLWAYPSLSRSTGGSTEGQAQSFGEATTNGGTVSEEAPKEPLTRSSGAASRAPKENSPTVTQAGYTIFPRCALYPVEGLELYYSPANPTAICVQPPDIPVQTTNVPTIRDTQLPPNCAVAPDSAVYCVIGGQLSADTLRALYNQGLLQTPKASGT